VGLITGLIITYFGFWLTDPNTEEELETYKARFEQVKVEFDMSERDLGQAQELLDKKDLEIEALAEEISILEDGVRPE